jgi:ubiquitin C-terminal hydrolase
LGNTCYLNAQLQTAFHVPKVRDVLMAPTEILEDNAPQKKKSIGLRVMRLLFQEMQASAESGFGDPVAPLQLCQSLGIPVMEQQDSQEFWKLLLPALECPQLMDLYQGAYEDYITAVDGSGRERRREEPFLDLSLEVAWYAPSHLKCVFWMKGKCFSHVFIHSFQQQRIPIGIHERHVWNS